jgi:hypothetical protein
MDAATQKEPRTPPQSKEAIDGLLGAEAKVSLNLAGETLTITRLPDGGAALTTASGVNDPEGRDITYVTDTVGPDGTPGQQHFENWSDGICLQRGHGSTSQRRIDYLLDKAKKE